MNGHMDGPTRGQDCPTGDDPKKLQGLPSLLTRQASMERESHLSGFPSDYSSSDLDFSFTSYASGSTADRAVSSARSSLSFPDPPARLSSASSSRPHRRTDPQWSALSAAAAINGTGAGAGAGVQLSHLRLVRRLGSGNLGRVFQCQLKGFDGADFALKVVDRNAASSRKLAQAAAEAEVLASLDHPFLPTLYARFEASHYTCLLIDYCPGGDLHSFLRSRPGGGRLSPPAARFYAAEVLVALEYLHAAGVVYRDLKPENVLLRADGHVMLSDFDLSFRSEVDPAIEFRELSATQYVRRRSRRRQRCVEAEFVAEPTRAYSKACVGTHEYLAPEVVNCNGHGNGVDWWAFGVFLYELLYGRTPFKGGSKDATLRNIATKAVMFPEDLAVMKAVDEEEMAEARDLILQLLVRDPWRRLGCTRGAQDIKRHPFFAGVEWALIRCYRPPVIFRSSSLTSSSTPSTLCEELRLGGGLERRRRGGGWWSRRLGCFGGNKGYKLGLSGKRKRSRKWF